MAEPLPFENRVAVITGAGHGIGRSHALLLAKLGAQIVVNDIGSDRHGEGNDTDSAAIVAAEIQTAGGTAIANTDDVVHGERIIEAAMDHFQRIDIVINNAGIIRDKSFHNMSEADWDAVYNVHLKGAFKVSHAAWPHFREQNYGRVLFTTSASGLYGNFGQANYSMAKLGLVGLTQTLAIEGRSKHIHVNAVAPLAGSRLTEDLMPANMSAQLKPELVSPLVAYLCHERCTETGSIFEAGGGWFGKLRWERALGVGLPIDRAITPELIAEHWASICNFDSSTHPSDNNEALTQLLANLKNRA